jgi:hypothetical protein
MVTDWLEDQGIQQSDLTAQKGHLLLNVPRTY